MTTLIAEGYVKVVEYPEPEKKYKAVFWVNGLMRFGRRRWRTASGAEEYGAMLVERYARLAAAADGGDRERGGELR